MFSKKKQPEEPAVEVKTEAKVQSVKEESAPPPVVATPATIGSSILIRGDVSGEENLTVDGAFELAAIFQCHTRRRYIPLDFAGTL